MNILVVDELHPHLFEKLDSYGLSYSYRPEICFDEAKSIIEDFHGIIIRSKFKINSDLIDKASQLKFIARAGSGLENIDVAYAKQKGIICINSPEASRDAVGEHTLGLLLSMLNHIPTSNFEVKSGIWNRKANWGREIKGQTIGIIGYGNMGSAFAEKLGNFGATVISYDKYKKGYSDSYSKEVDMNEIYARSDILSLHIPLSKETSNLICTEYVNNFTKPFYLINTSRGNMVDTKSLAKGIKDGKILGAALDVFKSENQTYEALNKNPDPDFEYLTNSNKVIFTPHVAGWTDEAFLKHSMVLAEKISKII